MKTQDVRFLIKCMKKLMAENLFPIHGMRLGIFQLMMFLSILIYD